MINLLIVKNPFKTEREIKQVDFIPGQPVFNYIQPFMMGAEDVVISHNGRIVEPEEHNTLIPATGDYIAVCPVIEGEGSSGKDVGRLLSTIALLIVTMGVGSWAAGGSFWLGSSGFVGMAGWGWGAYAAAMGTYIAGGLLINKLFPTTQPEQSQRYSWSNQPPVAEEGNAVPMTYGTVRMGVMAPVQVLSQRITSDGEKQYLNLLLCGGEGSVDYDEETGEITGISDIKINGQSYENFGEAIQIDIRPGTNNQTVIPGFDDTYETQYFNHELVEGHDWITYQTQGNAGQALEILLQCPSGLYKRGSDGKLSTAKVTVQAEYRKVGETGWSGFGEQKEFGAKYVNDNTIAIVGKNLTEVFPVGQHITMIHAGGKLTGTVINSQYILHEGKWMTLISLNVMPPRTVSAVRIVAGELVISGNTNTPIRKIFRLDDIPVGQYEVRCKCIAKSGTGDEYQTDVYWTELSHIYYDDFTHPNKVLVAIRALATDQLSGAMNISWLQTRSKVLVWNPETESYEWKNANNPAWACYDVLHRARYLKNINTGEMEYVVDGVPASRLDYYAFLSWANYCDTQGKELYFNGVLHQTETLWDALKAPESAGRGKVIIKGTKYSCICDAPSQPVQMFNVSNIVLDSFKEEFVGRMDRANALEITFFNTDRDYAEDTITVYGDDYDEATAVENPTQVRVPYAMSLAQAYRAGKYQLRLNKYIIRSVSWEADIDAINCKPGDVVLVQHDVPQWGIGGRIESASVYQVVLDQEVTLKPGINYAVMIRLSDDTLLEKAVQGVAEETVTRVLNMVEPFEEAPSEGDIYSFGEVKKVVRPVRLITTSRSSDFRRNLIGMEYIEEVYEEAEDIPVIDYTPLSASISDLQTVEHQDLSGNIWLEISWKAPGALYSGARILFDGKKIGEVGSSETSYRFNINNLASGTAHDITVEGLDQNKNVFDKAVYTHTIQGGHDLPPAAPQNLSYVWQTEDLKVAWDTVTKDNIGRIITDVKDYMIEVWVGGTKKRTEYVAGNMYTYTLPKNITDNTNPATSVEVKVYTRRDLIDTLSVAATKACTCPAPTAPTLTVTNAIGRVSLKVNVDDTQMMKFLKVQIKASQTSGFNPDTSGNLIHDNPSTVFEHTIPTGQTWYARARIVDKLGQASSWSSEVSSSPVKVGEADLDADVLSVNNALLIDNKTAHLWHFDKHLTSTSGIGPEFGYVAELKSNEGLFGGALKLGSGDLITYKLPAMSEGILGVYIKVS